ncbi:MAG TPA: transposase [Pyrinomonadaceae bacterium]|nr:transposase [Pyrinomonadaceae bacterium]
MVNTASDDKPAGWHSRGYLPHFDAGEVFQSITFRLHDSMPQDLLTKWREELARESDEIEDALRWRIEAYLDQGYGACHLADDRIAALVQSALLHFDGARYRLSAWVLMPNHVHLLAAPLAGHSLSNMMHSIKSYTAQQANKILQRNGRFWFEDYFDRYIRNAKHFENAIGYIESNPVRAALCNSPGEWRFGSACFRAREAHASQA